MLECLLAVAARRKMMRELGFFSLLLHHHPLSTSTVFFSLSFPPIENLFLFLSLFFSRVRAKQTQALKQKRKGKRQLARELLSKKTKTEKKAREAKTLNVREVFKKKKSAAKKTEPLSLSLSHAS